MERPSAARFPVTFQGHSLGALNLQVYAHTYPENVRGPILLDPTPIAWMMGEAFPELRELFDQETAAMRKRANAAEGSPDQEVAVNAAFLQAVVSEHEQLFGRTGEQVAAIVSFDNIPLTVIGASEADPRFGDNSQAFRQFWNDESWKLAGKSGTSQFILAKNSSHHIHQDSPQLVIDTIFEMIE